MANYSIKQKIGIYYNHIKWGEKVFDKILNGIPQDDIVQVKRGCGGSFCELKDGSFIETVRACDNSRGKKFTRVFVEPGIDRDIIDLIIRPSIIFTMQIVYGIDI